MDLSKLPTYTCHKTVRAFKIEHIVNRTSGGWSLIAADDTLGHLEVDDMWYSEHAPQEGDYLVAYEDGYTSYSPAEAFEAGYTLDERRLRVTPGAVADMSESDLLKAAAAAKSQ